MFDWRADKAAKFREKVQARAEELAEDLILDQFNRKYHIYGGYEEAPATTFTKDIIKNKIESADIKQKIDDCLTKEIVGKVVEDHLENALNNVLKEELLTEIVQRINNLQVKRNGRT